jgi:predicted CopG family antitoxin
MGKVLWTGAVDVRVLSVYAFYMAAKTIPIDLAAYEALRRRKGRNQSFSDVIKEHFGPVATGETLLGVSESQALQEETLDELDRIIAERGASRARGIKL